jgi:ribosomal protein S18 acetylase RimI-like enzyme
LHCPRRMGTYLLNRAKEIYLQQGLKTAAIMGAKRVFAPLVRLGTLYFFECDLAKGLPRVREVPGIVLREAFLKDLHLLEGTGHTSKEQALLRLRQGDRWFMGVEESTGKLTNYRWVTRTRSRVPEISRDLIVGPGEAYVYDLVTLPEFRRRGIDSYTRHILYDYLHCECGIRRILAYIHPENKASLMAARKFLDSIGRVRYACILGRGFPLIIEPGEKMPQFRKL